MVIILHQTAHRKLLVDLPIPSMKKSSKQGLAGATRTHVTAFIR